jgi:hypothetical protein
LYRIKGLHASACSPFFRFRAIAAARVAAAGGGVTNSSSLNCQNTTYEAKWKLSELKNLSHEIDRAVHSLRNIRLFPDLCRGLSVADLWFGHPCINRLQ